MHWKTSRRLITLDRPLVMGILNVTPDSFSDGGEFVRADDALRHAGQMVAAGADIIDIGGESTRPGSARVPVEEEIARATPVIKAIGSRFDVPISIDTTKSDVARAAIDAGAEIINDTSGLRWEVRLADLAASSGAGLVVMHSRGDFESMHLLAPVENILNEVIGGLRSSIDVAQAHGVLGDQIVLDVGIGFGKTPAQNLELIGNIDKIVAEFESYPVLVGASRKSFIGKVLGDIPATERIGASIAAALASVERGAKIVRVHDVAETVQALRFIGALQDA